MKAFILMIVTAFAFHFLLGEESEPTPTGATTGATLQYHVDRVAKIAKGVDWTCDSYAFEHVTDRLGLSLHWDTVEISEQGAWAFAVRDEVHMQIGVCHRVAQEVFFHEVGHILMGHCGPRKAISYTGAKEVEADHFSLYVMEGASLPHLWGSLKISE